jgi:S-adenosylmethionine decarboxylase
MAKSAGLHVIMDAYVSDADVFTKERIERLFTRLVEALDMKPLDKAQTYEVPVDPEILARVMQTGNFEDEGGITSVQVISTSHMSLHAWPLQKFFSLDVFSCKDFDSAKTIAIIREEMGVADDSTMILPRFKPGK